MRRCIFLLIFLISVTAGNVFAEEGKENVINFTKIQEEYKTYSSPVGISANSLGDVAIGFEDHHINVYGKDGNFKYGFAFKLYGTYFFNMDDQNIIMIFNVRGDTCYYFNTDAELIKKEKISDREEIKRYYKNYYNKRSVNIDEINYLLKEVFGYTKLIKTDANGNETIIFETGSQYIGRVFISLIILIFVVIVICGVIKTVSTEMKKYKEKTK